VRSGAHRLREIVLERREIDLAEPATLRHRQVAASDDGEIGEPAAAWVVFRAREILPPWSLRHRQIEIAESTAPSASASTARRRKIDRSEPAATRGGHGGEIHLEAEARRGRSRRRGPSGPAARRDRRG
jgi:hypothetical protein